MMRRQNHLEAYTYKCFMQNCEFWIQIQFWVIYKNCWHLTWLKDSFYKWSYFKIGMSDILVVLQLVTVGGELMSSIYALPVSANILEKVSTDSILKKKIFGTDSALFLLKIFFLTFSFWRLKQILKIWLCYHYLVHCPFTKYSWPWSIVLQLQLCIYLYWYR